MDASALRLASVVARDIVQLAHGQDCALFPGDTALAAALLLVELGGDVPFATPACGYAFAQDLVRSRGQAALWDRLWDSLMQLDVNCACCL